MSIRFDDITRKVVIACVLSLNSNHSTTIGGSKSAEVAADYAMIWRAAFEQNTVLVCLSYSGEIIGLNVNYVITKNDTFLKDVRNVVSTHSSIDRLSVDTF